MNYQYISVSRELQNAGDDTMDMLRRRRADRNACKRREKVARQKRTLLFSIFALILGVVLAFSVLGTNAHANGADAASEALYKCYKEVYVESGDTLWSIASKHTDGSVAQIQDCISEIRSVNDFGSLETLKAGTYIVVPYYTNEF